MKPRRPRSLFSRRQAWLLSDPGLREFAREARDSLRRYLECLYDQEDPLLRLRAHQRLLAAVRRLEDLALAMDQQWSGAEYSRLLDSGSQEERVAARVRMEECERRSDERRRERNAEEAERKGGEGGKGGGEGGSTH